MKYCLNFPETSCTISNLRPCTYILCIQGFNDACRSNQTFNTLKCLVTNFFSVSLKGILCFTLHACLENEVKANEDVIVVTNEILNIGTDHENAVLILSVVGKNLFTVNFRNETKKCSINICLRCIMLH